MAIQTQLIEYTHKGADLERYMEDAELDYFTMGDSQQGTLLEGYMAWDDEAGGPRPGVLIAHPWAGRTEFVDEQARRLAGLGYVGFALDMYGKGVRGNNREECAALMTQQTEDRRALQARMLFALETLRAQEQVDETKIAAIGYCFGGLCVLDLARSGENFAGAISFHGLLMPPEHPAPAINTPILVLHGYDDPMATPDQLDTLQQELTAAGADWQTHAFGGVMHAFTNPEANDPDFGTVYNARAEQRSRAIALDFLREVLD